MFEVGVLLLLVFQLLVVWLGAPLARRLLSVRSRLFVLLELVEGSRRGQVAAFAAAASARGRLAWQAKQLAARVLCLAAAAASNCL